MRFECELHILNRDGNPVELQDCVCPVNNILGSLFNCVNVEVSGRSINDPSNLYFMRSYLENLLGYNSEAMRSQLSSCGFNLDSTQNKVGVSGTYIAAVAAAAPGIAIPARCQFPNQDQIDRNALIMKVRPLQLSGKIHCDIFQQDKPLLPGVSLSLKFTRS